MAKKISLFNHKGGVGKTTLSINIADALADQGKTVLLVDADPQCNLTAFYIDEPTIDEMLGESSDVENGNTLWSSIQPVSIGRGGVKPIDLVKLRDNLFLAPGDVLLADHEERLSRAWSDSFSRDIRAYDVMCAISSAVAMFTRDIKADVIIYDVGPNVGPLNRALILDSDYFITPVAADLFSLRALTTVGRAIARWVTDWKTVRELATEEDRKRLLVGKPKYLGYLASAFKVSTGLRKANPHSYWEGKIAPRVSKRVAQVLREVDPSLVPSSSYKIGDVKHFHSLAAAAQEHGLAIGKLRGYVNSGHYNQVDEARAEFDVLAREITRRASL
jgi:cellulose biosynthesis protein BcsQ